MAAFLDLNGAKVLLDNIRKEFQSATAPDSAEILGYVQDILDSEGWQLDADTFTFGKLYKNISPYIKIGGINSAPNIDDHSVTIPATAIDSKPISISASGYEFNFEKNCTLQIDCSNSTIKTSGGNNSISASGNNLYFCGGHDSISNFNLDADTVGVESFLATISDSSDGSNTTLTFSTGADSSCLVLQNITSGTVQILIDKYPATYQIGSGLISDFQINSDSDVGITALDSGKSKLINLADYVNIAANANFVDNRGDFVTIASSNSNDSIFNSADNVSINSRAGKDLVSVEGENITICAGTANDSIYLSQSNSGHVLQFYHNEYNEYDSVWGYSDNDSIFIYDLSDTQVSWSFDSRGFEISFGKNLIYLIPPEDKLLGGTRLNVFNSDNAAIPIGIAVSEDGSTHYEIPKIFYGSNDANIITVNSALNGYTVRALNGNDTIFIESDAANILVDAGSGNDIINVKGGSGISIVAGYGNDTVNVESDVTTGRLYLFDAYAQGVNVINGLNARDTIQINYAEIPAASYPEYYSIKSAAFDNDGYFVLTFGDGRTQVKLKEAYQDGGKTSYRKMGEVPNRAAGTAVESFYLLFGEDFSKVEKFYIPFVTKISDTLPHEFNSDFSNSSVIGDSQPNIFVINGADSVSIDAGNGNNSIKIISGSSDVINTGAGNDSVEIFSGTSISINAGNGNDSILLHSGGHVLTYNRGDGDDTISGWQSDDSLNIIGYSSDKLSTLMTGENYNTFALKLDQNYITFDGLAIGSKIEIIGSVTDSSLVAADNGHFFITVPRILQGTANNDTLQNFSDSFVIEALNGDDYIVNTGNGVTVKAGLGNDTVDAKGDGLNVLGGGGDDFIKVDDSANSTINAGNGNDTIILGENVSNSTIIGGGGDDLIIANNRPNVFSYTSGNGNDSIFGFKSSDSIQIFGAAVNSDTATTANGLVIALSDGSSLTLKGKRLPNSDGGFTSKDFDFLSSSDSFVITTFNTVDGAEISDTFLVSISNQKVVTKKIPFENLSDNFFIKGTTAADSITNHGDYVTILADRGNDSLTNSGDFVSLSAGAGNDSISNSGSSVTIQGGVGNDLIWGNSSDSSGSVYQYASGDGFDTIYNFGVNDRISLDGSDFSTSLIDTDNPDTKDVVFSIGAGSITLKDIELGRVIFIDGVGSSSVSTTYTVTDS